jgi:hypothetical protein
MSMQSKVLMALSVLSSTLLLGWGAMLTATDSRAEFQGVWRTVELVVPGPAPQTIRPAATLAIFHGRHYSRVGVQAEGERPSLKDPAAASADELRAVWGPFAGEAGTFEVSGNNVVTMQALVAKNPVAMTNGATSVFTYQRKGDTLTLTQVRTPFGASVAPMTIKLVRVD